jgi:signal peptidase I
LLGTEYPMMVVVSQSMVPTLGVGDYIIVAQIPDIREMQVAPQPIGEIIVFLKPGSTDEYIVHRAIKKTDINGKLSFITKGDNNTFSDGTPVPEANVIGKVIGHLPIIGYFSLFIKTTRGFGLIIGFMALAFFIDYVLPTRKSVGGKFPILALIPLTVAPLVTASFWSIQNEHIVLENLAVGIWYLVCFLLPIAFQDDDTGVMVWLYHLVLIMVPIACDIVWWTSGITPSMWWYTTGSTVPINWLLMKEQPSFEIVFNSILMTLIPGVVIFVVTLYAKRKGWNPIFSLHRRLRGAPPEASPTETTSVTVISSTASDSERISDPEPNA